MWWWLAMVACKGQGDAVGSGDFVSLRVDPEEIEVEVQTGVPAVIPFEAVATFTVGGESAFDLVSWSSSNLSVGDIDSQGVFTTVDTNGGVTEVTASHLGSEATATLRVVYTEDILDNDLPQELADAFKAVDGATSLDLQIVYPPDGVAVPRNLEGLSFKWSAPEDATVARLRMQSDITDVSVYTLGIEWTATKEIWERVAAANRQGEVDVTLSVGVWDGTTLSNVRTAEPIALKVYRMDARGSLIYWATHNESIMRIPFGELQAEEFWTPEDSNNRCTGCHVISSERDRMVVVHDGIGGTFSIINIEDPEAPALLIGPASTRRTSFNAISPDGTRLITSVGPVLSLYDIDTGTHIQDLDVGDDFITQPDWAPDGSAIVGVRVTGTITSDFNFTGGEIVELAYTEGEGLGEPVVLVERSQDYNYYYPAYSPDGEWIAFNRAVGSSYSSAESELFLISRDRTIWLELGNANVEGELDSYARWGPLPDDDVLWLAFSSRRAYPLAQTVSPQIWVTAIDVEKALLGEDPSSAPFWMPGQETNSNNHLPYWWSK